MSPHLNELRVRIMHALTILGITFFVCYFFSNSLYDFISTPILAKSKPGTMLITTQVTAPFMVPLQLSFICALLICMPYILYQIWMFMRPALYQRERATIAPLVITSCVLFYCGILFAVLVIAPIAMKFFTNSGPANVTVMLDIANYLDFIITIAVATGIAFQIPVITKVLIKAGIVSKQQLIAKRKHVIVLAMILGMLLAPPDVVSQLLISIPMWLLFELGLLLPTTATSPQPSPPNQRFG